MEKIKPYLTLIDCGGHASYHITGHYFHRNNPNNVAILCHDITRDKPDDYNKTFQWLKSVITRSPKCQMLIMLTKKDQVVGHEKQKMELFIQNLSTLLQNEIDMLNILLQTAKSSSGKLERIKSVIIKYCLVKDTMKDNLLIISCEQDQSESINQVKKTLLDMADRCKLLLPETSQELFISIGVVAAKSYQLKVKSTERSNLTTAMAASNITSKTIPAENQNKNVGRLSQFKKLFGFSKSGNINKGKEHTTSVSREEDNTKPELKSCYLQINELIPTYRSILTKYQLPLDDIKETLKNSLQFLDFQGFLMYYGSNKELDNIVFHDMKVLIDVLKTVFHHRAAEIFTVKNPDLLRKFYDNNEKKFEDDHRLYQEGLLSEELLGYHLAVRNVQIDAKIVMNLLTCIEAGFMFQPENDSKKYIYIPFLIEKKRLSG